MSDYSRLIEHAFPLRQASIDSVHEKNVRHGHISTLHVWPARRPLAASRAALLATLLPDPGTPEARKALCEKIGGTLKMETDKEGRMKEATEGGVLRWKREIENEATLNWLRREILKANGGDPPKVLDPFAGGGAIPLEAMRIGCDVTAADLNPVAWFVLKCTLEYPQRLAGQTRPLPDFILRDREFMEEFLKKAKGLKGAKLKKTLEALGHGARAGEQYQNEMDFEGAAASAGISLEAEIAWHVRAWGRRMLAQARKDLAPLYPTYADWQPLMPGKPYEAQQSRLVDPDENGLADASRLNADLSQDYLQDKFNPRWVAKPVAAYMWARTVTCKNCRATIPLLKTLWLCKKDGKRIRLSMMPNAEGTGPNFSIEYNVPERGGNSAQKREHDKKLGTGTMSKAGAQCLCCPAIMEAADIRYEGRNARLGQILTAVVTDGPHGKEYRLPTIHERTVGQVGSDYVQMIFQDIPFGLPEEPLPTVDRHRAVGSQLPGYGLTKWSDMFSHRQLAVLGALLKFLRASGEYSMSQYDGDWKNALRSYLAIVIDKTADYGSALATWIVGMEIVRGTFARFAFSWCWDWCEVNPLEDVAGGIPSSLRWCSLSLDTLGDAAKRALAPAVLNRSAIDELTTASQYDLLFTDPPYYDAIPYADLMDFFYVWLRRSLVDTEPTAFSEALTPKWDSTAQNGELIDDPGAHNGDRTLSKAAYEAGMGKVFKNALDALKPNGRCVIVFAHKSPDAWETLVAAIIKAGATVVGSWPIQSERGARTNAIATASLASSIWMVCRKRDPLARVGWDNRVLAEMRENIATQLREFWDAGIRGPDFVWAATGPAMEAYSKYPAVKKANSPTNEFLSVKEFLDSVRRIVIEFVVGRVLHIESGTDRLDSVTSYYLLHRNDFDFEKAPAGACILYAVSCGLSDAELERTWNLIKVKGSKTPEPDESEEDGVDQDSEAPEEMSGSEFILRTWKERHEKRMGYESIGGREVPLIDRVHRLMHLWRDGDVRKVDDYLDTYALRRNELFVRLIQSLIELSKQGSEERALLESLSNHLGAKAAKADTTRPLAFDDDV